MDTPDLIERIIEFILAREGGFTNRPEDSGGPTNFGITLKLWEAIHSSPIPSVDTIKNLTRTDAAQFYREYFAYPLKINLLECAPLIALIVMDQAVNSGPSPSVRRLQAVLNDEFGASLKTDGILGSTTVNAVLAVNAQALAIHLIKKTQQNYIDLAEKYPKNQKFLTGWLNRVDEYKVWKA